MATIDLVKAASTRSYMEFETQGIAELADRLKDSQAVKDYRSKLAIAQGITESDDDMDDKELDEMKDMSPEEKEAAEKAKKEAEEKDEDDK